MKTLKEYLKNCTYMPESLARKLLEVLRANKGAKITMLDADLGQILVLENEELQIIGRRKAFKNTQPVPLKLFRDLQSIFLKDSFLEQVKRMEPETFQTWENFLTKNRRDFKTISVSPGGSGEGVKVDRSITLPLVGKGRQGAVYRIDEDKCIKIYGKPEHASREKKVLLSNQHLSFIPKVYETGENYILMEYLQGPDLNTFLKKQNKLSEQITQQLLEMLTAMKQSKFKLIDAPLRHIIVTNSGFKLVDHVYSYTRNQDRPLELFENLHERNFLDSFLGQVKAIDPKTWKHWTKEPFRLKNGGRLDFKKKFRKVKTEAGRKK